jgi:hypothetical protein
MPIDVCERKEEGRQTEWKEGNRMRKTAII